MARRTDPFSAFYRGPHAITSRVVLLTGAAGGIGRVMTLALLRGGHCIRTHQNRSTKKKIEAACALPKSLIPTHAASCEITKTDPHLGKLASRSV
jgi:NAD(P)-dependent dehydrogenase (short-subunit alcohol dehydrogenase family)